MAPASSEPASPADSQAQNSRAQGSQAQLIASDEFTRLSMVAVSDMDNRAYILQSTTDPQDVLLIDAPSEPDVLRAAIGAEAAPTIVITHQHHDHTGALADMLAEGTRLIGHPLDIPAVEEMRGVTFTDSVDDDGTVTAGGVTLDVIWLRGHTPGSIALATTIGGVQYLFTGDSLFPGGVGNTWNDPERFATLIDDVETKLFARYPDDTVVLPGHGKGTTLGAERASLPEWRARGW